MFIVEHFAARKITLECHQIGNGLCSQPFERSPSLVPAMLLATMK
jgi:hypothetical protein